MRPLPSVAIAITVFRDASRLDTLLNNMRWSGWPDIPTYVFEDPFEADRKGVSNDFAAVCDKYNVPLSTAPFWGCMHGIIQFAMENTKEDWIIYIPDDVLFTRGGLWNEYMGVLAYGREFIGGIQAPYWNADELVTMGIIPHKKVMYEGWVPDGVGQNPHWNWFGVPRKYINLNGAGFSLNRELWRGMGGWSRHTWRLDEYAGYKAWQLGMACITLPGPPRVHYFGGATHLMPEHEDYSSVENWKKATGGTPTETGNETRVILDRVPESFDDILKFWNMGGRW